jgi:hypothetical protein
MGCAFGALIGATLFDRANCDIDLITDVQDGDGKRLFANVLGASHSGELSAVGAMGVELSVVVREFLLIRWGACELVIYIWWR